MGDALEREKAAIPDGLRGAGAGANPLSRILGFRSLIRFALPTMTVMVFMGLYTVVDTIFVARFVDENALAAINVVCPVINLIVGLAAMLSTGGSAIIARKMGAGDEERARRDFTLIILAGAVLGVAVSVFGTVFIDGIVQALGAGRTLFPYCKSYLSVILAFAPACVLQVLFQNLIVTAGRPGIGMLLAFGSGTANAVLDCVFMGPLRMGIAGAAVATGIGYAIPTVTGVAFFSVTKGSLRFRAPVLDAKTLGECCFNGSSEMVGQLASAVTTFLFNAGMMRLLGETGVAAITIIVFSQFLLSSLHFGFSMGVAPVISYNHGSGDRARLKRIYRGCLAFLAAVSLCVFVFAVSCREPLVGLFAPQSPFLRRLASDGLLLYSPAFLFCGLNIFASASFTALSNGKDSAILSFLRTFGFVTIGLVALPRVLGTTGIWIAVPVAEACSLIVSAAFILRHRGRYGYL